MYRALGGHEAIRLTTFQQNDHDNGRGATNETTPIVTHGDAVVALHYEEANNKPETVYLALSDIDNLTTLLRQDIQDEHVLDSVQVKHIPSGFVRICPVCGEHTTNHTCTELRQWILPSPPLSIDKSTHIHTECCNDLADALDHVWQHTAEALNASL